jgi:hypothetical protein
MNTEYNTKEEVSKTAASKPRKSGKSIRIDGVPEFAHKDIKKYRNKLNVNRGKDYTINQAYCEYVVEKLKEDKCLDKHLSKMLDEWEAQFETGTQYSEESKQEYIEAASFMRERGRKGDLIDTIEETIN